MEIMTEQKIVRARKRSTLKQVLKVLVNIFFIGVLVSVAVIMFFTFQSKMTSGKSSIAGYKIFVVLSGSMEPTLHTGSVVAVKPIDITKLSVKDIITFKGFENSNVLLTHRIVAINQGKQLTFVTRGDANDANDPALVPAEDVIGKVSISIPYAGYLMEFARSKEGFLVLVIIPGALIIILEMRKLLKYAVQLEREKQEKIIAELEKKAANERSEV